MSIYVKKIKKTIPVSTKTTCNVYNNYTNKDGSYTSCKLPRVKGETICKHHSIALEQKINDIYMDEQIFLNKEQEKNNSIKIDYRRNLVIYSDKDNVYVYRFVNNNLLSCLDCVNIFSKDKVFEKANETGSETQKILSPIDQTNPFSSYSVKVSCSKRIASSIISHYPSILDFIENETTEIIESIYPSDISDIIISYTDIRNTKHNTFVYRCKQYLKEFGYSCPDKKLYLFGYHYKTIFPWNEILLSHPKFIDIMYSSIVGTVLFDYSKDFTLKDFKEVLERLKKIKFESYKKGYCECPDIEFQSLPGIGIEKSTIENEYHNYLSNQ